MIYEYSKRLLLTIIIGMMVMILFLGENKGHAEEPFAIDLNWDWPAAGEITDHFGTRGGSHYGLDIAAPRGTSVFAVEDGTVNKSYYSSTYGNVIFISHPNGFETVYAHLHERFIEEGAQLEKGTLIGTIGNTGRSRGNHLHFEVHNGEWNIHKSNAVNPTAYLKDGIFAAEKEEGDAIEASSAQDMKISKEIVTIEKGDTLWALSKEYNVTVEQLQEWNELPDDFIVVDQKLIVYVAEAGADKDNTKGTAVNLVNLQVLRH
jgi:murein DD-endopeptidase MepM/ murein hydrolase activator NlpD